VVTPEQVSSSPTPEALKVWIEVQTCDRDLSESEIELSLTVDDWMIDQERRLGAVIR